jgi:hypothetical protein
MPRALEGVYRAGRIELAERPEGLKEESRVRVTIVPTDAVDLRERGMEEAQAADLRNRLAAFAEDWDSPEMAIYDDYDANLVPTR